jgi:DNA polymerase-3 subunit delta
VRKGEVAPAYLVAGEEDALRERSVRALEGLVAEEDRELDLERIDGRGADWGRVVAAARTLPWQSPRRVVTVSAAQRVAGEPEGLLEYLDDPSPRSVLVLEARAVDGRRNPWKGIGTRCVLVECKPLSDAELEGEAAAALRDRNVKATRPVVRRIIELVGQDLSRLQSEVEKLALVAEGGTLTQDDVEALVGRSRERAVWDFTDALALRDGDRALLVLDEMLEDGASEHYLVAMAEWSFRNLLAGKDLVARGRSPRQAAGELNVRGPGAQRLADGLGRYEQAALRDTFHRLAALDRSLKSSRLPARVHLERFVFEVCRPAR